MKKSAGRPRKTDRSQPIEKICTKCGKLLSITEFSLIAKTFWHNRVDHHQSQCKHCRKLNRLYGITSEEYDALLQQQQGKCAICGSMRSTGKSARLVVDHDHVSGKVRGLLCNNCNSAIGHLLESPNTLRNAIAYVERHKGLEGPEWRDL